MKKVQGVLNPSFPATDKLMAVYWASRALDHTAVSNSPGGRLEDDGIDLSVFLEKKLVKKVIALFPLPMSLLPRLMKPWKDANSSRIPLICQEKKR